MYSKKYLNLLSLLRKKNTTNFPSRYYHTSIGAGSHAAAVRKEVTPDEVFAGGKMIAETKNNLPESSLSFLFRRSLTEEKSSMLSKKQIVLLFRANYTDVTHTSFLQKKCRKICHLN